MERQNLQYKAYPNNLMLGHDLKANTAQNQDNLNMSQLYRNGESGIDEKRSSQFSDPSVIKQQSQLQNGQCLRPSHSKSRGEVLSGISFSRFQAISEQNQNHEHQSTIKSSNTCKKQQTNKVPTSTKVISSNKLIQNPIQVKSFDQGTGQKCNKQEKHGYCFQFNYLKQTDLFEKFIKFSTSKGMDFIIGDSQITVIKKVAFFKSVLSLCFPSNSGFEHQVYQLTFVSENNAKLTQVSGVDQNYYQFREQFMVQLWANKYLICSSMHQNLRHFLRFANSIKSQCKDSKGKKMGQIDCLKTQIETAIKKISNRCQDQKIRQDPKKLKQRNEPTYKIDSPQLTCVKKKVKQMQQTLKCLLQKQLKKQQSLKKLRTGEYNKIGYDAEGVLIQKQISIQKQREKQKQKEEDMEHTKIFVTPSMQRMLMNLFYLYLDLEELVKKYVVGDKDISDFQKKKMIIKSSLSPSDIFRYLELQDFSKSLESLPQDQQRQQLFPQSIKLLSSLRYSTYPSPDQTLEVLSILKTSIVKQIELLNKVLGNCRVKVQDHTNLNRTLLQFCIYCIIMCDNKDIFPTIETAFIFSYGSDSRMGVFVEESVKTAEVIKRGIDFIDKQWQL